MIKTDKIASRLRRQFPPRSFPDLNAILDERDRLRAVLRDMVNGEYDGQFGSDALCRRALATLEGKPLVPTKFEE